MTHFSARRVPKTAAKCRGRCADSWSNRTVRPKSSIPVLVLAVIAVVCALVPTPAATVERVYSRGMYPAIQRAATTVSNRVPFALLDVAVGVLLLVGAALFVVRTRRVGIRGTARFAAWAATGIAALIYLWFLGMWGLNYRRVPLEQKLDYDRSRLTRAAAIDFANMAVAQANAEYAARRIDTADIGSLQRSFAEAQRALGADRVAVTGIPKRSLLNLYFRRAAIDGMTDPFFLEIIVNPDVLEFERPFVLAHEWAHLAGYADEAEANFVAWVTCIRADAPSRYSGWLAAYQHGLAAVPRPDRQGLTRLDPGPVEDLRAMAARYARSSPVVRNAARGVYDEYLRANRVAEGIASYDAVVRLMIGTRFDADGKPARR
jgi:hypothetical protein